MKIFLILLLLSATAFAKPDIDNDIRLMTEFMKNCKALGAKCDGSTFGGMHPYYNIYIHPQCNNQQKTKIEYSDEGRINSIECDSKIQNNNENKSKDKP